MTHGPWPRRPDRPDTVGDVMRHEVIRSPRRRKTVQARLVDGVVQVSIPARMTKAEEDRWVAVMVGRFQRKLITAPIDLAARAEQLATRYRLPQPRSIRWVDNQEWRWGSCTPADRTIRLSSRLGGFPPWVVDYVIVHELAHLVVAGHGAGFWALVDRYPRAERARGFLLAKGMDSDDELDAPRPETRRQVRREPRPRAEAGSAPTLW